LSKNFAFCFSNKISKNNFFVKTFLITIFDHNWTAKIFNIHIAKFVNWKIFDSICLSSVLTSNAIRILFNMYTTHISTHSKVRLLKLGALSQRQLQKSIKSSYFIEVLL
jgi:hypothetical protein